MFPGPFQPDFAGKCRLYKCALSSPSSNSWSFWHAGEAWKLPQLSGELVGARARGLRSTFFCGKSTACPSTARWMGHRDTGLRLVWERQTKGNSLRKMALIYREIAWLEFLGTEQLIFFPVISPGYTVEHTTPCSAWSDHSDSIESLTRGRFSRAAFLPQRFFSLFQPEPCSTRG